MVLLLYGYIAILLYCYIAILLYGLIAIEHQIEDECVTDRW